MCHQCVIDGVKSNMLSRRSFFSGAAALGAAALATTAVPQPLFAQAAAPAKAEDLTHELWETFPTYFGGQQLWIEQKFSHAKDTFNLNEWRLSEHTGTHIDAPLHFSADASLWPNLRSAISSRRWSSSISAPRPTPAPIRN